MLAELEYSRPGLTVRGVSIAARATSFVIPEFDVVLDVGRLGPATAAHGTVLLSHGHLDHTAGILAWLNLRARFHPRDATRVIGPAAVIDPMRQALAVMPGMESVRKRFDLAAALIGVEPGTIVPVDGGEAEPFAVDHGPAAFGWTLRRTGQVRAALVYAADGTVAPFRADPALLDAEVAIVECTFVEANRRVAAVLSGHAHIADWLELAPVLTCDTLILAHLPLLPAATLAVAMAPLVATFGGELVLWAAPPE